MGGTRRESYRSEVDSKNNILERTIRKKKQGKTIDQWEDDVVKIAGPNWSQISQDREQWISLEEAFTQPGVLAGQTTF